LSAYSFLLNIFYSRFFKTCFETKATNTLPVYCLLDEAGHTKIPNLATVIATIRKYKVSISLIFQSLSQMENLYGKAEAQVILGGGITSKVFYAGCDDETCDKLEKILGNITTKETDRNGRIYTKHEPLMRSQEIRMMSDNQALYLFSNRKPIILNIRPFYKSWKFNGYTQIKPYTGIDRALPSVKYINLDN
jgi:type IV secretion system protein VirD4